MENIWEGRVDADKYFAMLRDSVQRAADLTAQMVEEAGGVREKLLRPPPPLADFKARGLAPPRPAPKAPRIMIVDDEPAALLLFDRLLTEAGYEVATAQSGFECLDQFTRSLPRWDLVILDLTLPFMDGEETFHRLRVIAPEVPVLLTTGFVTRERLDAMVTAGLAGFMPKPVPADELLAQVAATINPEEAGEGLVGSGIAAAY
jgi:CheY-like chemotaxis protein